MTSYQKALDFAERAHRGQFRKNGKVPYISHPISVAEIAKNLCDELLEKNKKNMLTEKHWDDFKRDEMKLVEVVALLHDAQEDCEWVTHELLVEEFGEEVAGYVDALTKREGEDYLDAVLRAKQSFVTRVVKIADNTHNLQDLSRGSLRDKYMLSKWILQSI